MNGPAWAGLTRNQAIEIFRGMVSAPPHLRQTEARSWIAGAQDMLAALASAGAFSDGRNMADRLPHDPWRKVIEALPPTKIVQHIEGQDEYVTQRIPTRAEVIADLQAHGVTMAVLAVDRAIAAGYLTVREGP